ncbi:AKAP7 2'5' RNA ligase-like domain-containing protein [Roridomyces roridus]|uniref:AKAP7 2'5' RNA ligase-like domain-containing protein n=1 Tax=Roridomyces roridus TaxID=1738132 RepID=A0AAD7B828_9AGAR|nr:AKAP7 2'5' RNA ligase-like domain-containing protein [Roridomyces roridus]
MASKARTVDSQDIVSKNIGAGTGRPRGGKRQQKKSANSSPRPTHFLSVPLGHHPALRDRIHQFHDSLMPAAGTTPTIEGLDRSILVDPRRLHFTLGVMALSSADGEQSSNGKTLSAAIDLLRSLTPELEEITQRRAPVVKLDKMGVLKTTQRQQAGVLYVSPSDESEEDAQKVIRILDLVSQKFRQEGFIEEAARPSVLHCTLINASHRKPRRDPRTFSYREIFERASETSYSAAAGERTSLVDFGAWAVSEIQLCKMGSHGPDNEYVSCASVALGMGGSHDPQSFIREDESSG